MDTLVAVQVDERVIEGKRLFIGVDDDHDLAMDIDSNGHVLMSGHQREREVVMGVWAMLRIIVRIHDVDIFVPKNSFEGELAEDVEFDFSEPDTSEVVPVQEEGGDSFVEGVGLLNRITHWEYSLLWDVMGDLVCG